MRVGWVDTWRGGCAQYKALIKDETELQTVKVILQRHWGAIRDAFKHYSTPGPSPFNVGLLSWTQFCQDAHLVDNHSCSLNDVDRIFMAANVLSKDVKFYRKEKSRIPDRQLVRPRDC